MTASPLPPSAQPPSPRPPKQAYQAPRVQVYGDVKTLTGSFLQSGLGNGISNVAMSRNLFS